MFWLNTNEKNKKNIVLKYMETRRHIDMEIWSWRHGHGVMETETSSWRHIHADIVIRYRYTKKYYVRNQHKKIKIGSN
jgi:hypothetical protein